MGRCTHQLGARRSDADGVEAAVDVDDLAGGGREPVRQQGDDRLGDRLGVVDAQPSGARSSQMSSNSAKPGMHLAAIVCTGPAATRLKRMFCGPSSLAR